MPFKDPFNQDHSDIEWHRRLFEQTGSVLHVWRCIQICTELNAVGVCEGFPDWVMKYLDGTAKAVEELWVRHQDGDVKSIGSEIAAALGFKDAGQGKRSSAFTEFDRGRRNRALAEMVLRKLLENPGMTKTEACTFLAEDLAEAAITFETSKLAHRPEYTRQVFEIAYSEDVITEAWQEWGDFVMQHHERWRRPTSGKSVHSIRKT